MLKKIFLTAVRTLSATAILTVVACSDKSTDEGNAAELTGNTPTQQTFYADETQKSGSIAFKAKTSWTASVFELATKAEEGRVAWLSLNQYSGTAGNVALTLTLEKNMTGNDRKAEIRIACGTTVLRITVEQKATKEDGSLPEEKPSPDDPNDPDNPGNPDDPNNPENPDNPDDPNNPDNPDNPENPDNPDDPNNPKNQIIRIEKADGAGQIEARYDFTYDDTGRLIKIDLSECDNAETFDYFTTTKISYGNQTVAYEISYKTSDGTLPYKPTGKIQLNGTGQAVSGEFTTFDNKNGIESWLTTYTFSYNSEGELIESTVKEESQDSSTISYRTTWTNGNPTQLDWGPDKPHKWLDKATYGSKANTANLDLNWFLLLDTDGWLGSIGDPEKIFAILGYTGKRPKNLAETVTTENIKATNNSAQYTFTHQIDGESRITKIIEEYRYNQSTQSYQTIYSISYAE